MSVEFRVDIEPDGGSAWRLQVNTPTLNQASGTRLARPNKPQLATSDLEEIRRGLPGNATIQRVADEVNNWFLSNDVSHILAPIVQNGSNERVRLILSVDERLQNDLADVPFELLRLHGAHSALVLNHRVESLVHMLPKIGRISTGTSPRNWPLRLLIFRANPLDLGGDVPEVAHMAEEIRKEAEDRGIPLGLLDIDVISRENQYGTAATWEEFRRCIRAKSYDILVFMGHGDVLPGDPPSSNLLFEDESGAYSVAKEAAQLAVALQNNVPVVLLVGCLTSATGGSGNASAKWTRGQQGVAQALVNSAESGVRIAVGMRSRLEIQDALAFLKGFFTSLLADAPGHVEVAVRSGREEMHGQRIHPPGWAAPMLFSALEPEPFFGFLGQRPDQGPSPGEQQRIEAQSDILHVMWGALSKQPVSQRSEESVAAIRSSINALETKIRQITTEYGPTILPDLTEAAPGQQIQVSVKLWGNIETRGLTGRFRLPSALKLLGCRTHPRLRAIGCHVLTGEDNFFRIEPLPGAPTAIRLTDDLPLFEVILEMDSAPRSLETLAIEILTSDPPRFIWPGENAIIVSV